MDWILERTLQGGSYPMFSDTPTSFSMVYGFTNAVGPYSLGEMNATPINMCESAWSAAACAPASPRPDFSKNG